MVKHLQLFLILLCLLHPLSAQHCKNHKNDTVSWFVVLVAPKSVSQGYLYFDSTSTGYNFTSHSEQPDSPNHPIQYTFKQVGDQGLRYLAWNDQFPNGTTSSSKAHSKQVIAYQDNSLIGFVVDHSIPKYPDFIGDKINQTINDSQSIYGQHFICVSTSGSMTMEILKKSTIIKQNVYASKLDKDYNMTTTAYTLGGTPLNIIYKNGNLNGSIFEDGLTLKFKSAWIAETWGRPIQDPWCGNKTIPYGVGNAGGVTFSDGSRTWNWKQTQDHSKWAVSTSQGVNTACFGDMNRMSSQWTRGGTFYCFTHTNLYKAMSSLVAAPTACA